MVRIRGSVEEWKDENEKESEICELRRQQRLFSLYVGGLRKFKVHMTCLKSEELKKLVSMQKCVSCTYWAGRMACE
jgi:hypothetical protein